LLILYLGLLAGWLYPMLLVSLLLTVLRGMGLRLIDLADENGRATGARLQFSLQSVLAWMTVVAVVLGIGKYVTEAVPWEGEPLWRVLDVPMILAPGLLAPCMLWLILGERWLALRLCLPVVVMAAAIAGQRFIGVAPSPTYLWALALDGLLVLGSLLVFRVAGYRVGFRPAPRGSGIPGP